MRPRLTLLGARQLMNLFLCPQFREAVAEWREYKAQAPDRDALALSAIPIPYVKDWHLSRIALQRGSAFYKLPKYFAEDWLNDYFDGRNDEAKDDYRFVYLGPKGSWTPLHSDVLCSFSWSHNLCGRKLWIFFPPSEKDKIQDRYAILPCHPEPLSRSLPSFGSDLETTIPMLGSSRMEKYFLAGQRPGNSKLFRTPERHSLVRSEML